MARNDTFALAIATGATVVDAAAQAGISTRTAWRQLQDSDVQAAIARARDEVFTRTVNGLAEAALAGIATLRAALETGPPSVRVRAAEVLLALAIRYRDHADTEQRIAELEERLRPMPETHSAGASSGPSSRARIVHRALARGAADAIA